MHVTGTFCGRVRLDHLLICINCFELYPYGNSGCQGLKCKLRAAVVNVIR